MTTGPQGWPAARLGPVFRAGFLHEGRPAGSPAGWHPEHREGLLALLSYVDSHALSIAPCWLHLPRSWTGRACGLGSTWKGTPESWSQVLVLRLTHCLSAQLPSRGPPQGAAHSTAPSTDHTAAWPPGVATPLVERGGVGRGASVMLPSAQRPEAKGRPLCPGGLC